MGMIIEDVASVRRLSELGTTGTAMYSGTELPKAHSQNQSGATDLVKYGNLWPVDPQRVANLCDNTVRYQMLFRCSAFLEQTGR